MGVYSLYYIKSSSDQKIQKKTNQTKTKQNLHKGRCQVGWVMQRRYPHDVHNHVHDLTNLTRRMKPFPNLIYFT